MRAPRTPQPGNAPPAPLFRSINARCLLSPRGDACEVAAAPAAAATTACLSTAADTSLETAQAPSEDNGLEHWVCAWAERMYRSIAEASTSPQISRQRSGSRTPSVWPMSARGASREPVFAARTYPEATASASLSVRLQALLPNNSREQKQSRERDFLLPNNGRAKNNRRRRNRPPGRRPSNWDRDGPLSARAEPSGGLLSSRAEPSTALHPVQYLPSASSAASALSRVERALQPLLQAAAADLRRDSRHACWSSTPGTTPGPTPRMPDVSQPHESVFGISPGAGTGYTESQYQSSSSPGVPSSVSPPLKSRLPQFLQSPGESQATPASVAGGCAAGASTGSGSARRPPVPLLSLGKLSLGAANAHRSGGSGSGGACGDNALQAGASSADSLRSTMRPVPQEAAASTDGVPTPTVSEWRARPPPPHCWQSDGANEGTGMSLSSSLPIRGSSPRRHLDLVSEEQRGASISSSSSRTSCSSRCSAAPAPTAGDSKPHSEKSEKASLGVPPLELAAARALSPEQDPEAGCAAASPFLTACSYQAEQVPSGRSSMGSDLNCDRGSTVDSALSMPSAAPIENGSPEVTARYCVEDPHGFDVGAQALKRPHIHDGVDIDHLPSSNGIPALSLLDSPEAPWWHNNPRINRIVGLLDKVQRCIEQQRLLGLAKPQELEKASLLLSEPEDSSDSSTAAGDGDGDGSQEQAKEPIPM